MRPVIASAFIAVVVIALAMFSSCQNDDQLIFKRYYLNGKLVFEKRCQNCHGSHGEGLSNLIPPLTDTTFLRANRQRLPCFINFGIKGKLLKVNGKTFTTDMPANDIPAVDIAEVTTYITNSFGNKQGVTTTEDVVKQLQDCR